jgi:nucleoside-diphosphate-sugar epimerase
MMLNGDMGGVCLPLGLPWVDVEDVASAHILAALTPTATGRYLCCSEAGTVPDILQAALTAYPEPLARCRISLKIMPKFVGQVLGFFGMYPGELIRGQWGVVPAFDNGKACKELGMRFMPVARSVADMAQRFIDLGEVKPKV